MSPFHLRSPSWARTALRHRFVPIVIVITMAACAVAIVSHDGRGTKQAAVAEPEVSSQSKRLQRFSPTPLQWASLGLETVTTKVFRSEHVTEGRISINEDRSTPIFPPYAGRVTRLMAKAGDAVKSW